MQLLNIFHVLLAIAMIALILVQRGAGATAGAAFGGGASGTVFGSSGAGNFLTRTTSVAAIGFFAISMAMAVMASRMNAEVVTADQGVLVNDSVITEQAIPEMPADQAEVPTATQLPADIPLVQPPAQAVTDDMPAVDGAAQDSGNDSGG